MESLVEDFPIIIGMTSIGVSLLTYKYGIKWYNNRLITFYCHDRNWKHLTNNININNDIKNKIRVMQYNILGNGYEDMFEYTNFRYRKWDYRFTRIMAQINAYNPDIICVQETTKSTYENYMKDDMHELGYNNYHVNKNISRERKGYNPVAMTVFYRNNIELINMTYIKFNGLINNYDYTDIIPLNLNNIYNNEYIGKLKYRSDAVMIMHMKYNDKDFIICNSHLFWNPKYSHVKSAQAMLLNKSIINTLKHDWNIDFNSVPIILGIDANSTPNNDNHSTGVYSIMTNGILNKLHQDHPYSKILANIKRKLKIKINSTDNYNEYVSKIDNFDINEDDISKYSFLKEVQFVKNLDDFKSELTWKSVYGIEKEPLYTTKTSDFCDTIDYIVKDIFTIYYDSIFK